MPADKSAGFLFLLAKKEAARPGHAERLDVGQKKSSLRKTA